MQKTSTRDLAQPSTIGNDDTSPVAQELPTYAYVDGMEYKFAPDKNPETLPAEFDTVHIQIPCIRCDTKNELQYSGSIPALISCTCSHCGKEIEVSRSTHQTEISTATLYEKLKNYQEKRLAYIEGQNRSSTPSELTQKIVSYLGGIPFLLSSVASLYLFENSYTTLPDGTLAVTDPTVAGFSILFSLLSFLIFFAMMNGLLQRVQSWYFDIPYAGGLGPKEFKNGIEDSNQK